jgi:hypothetical protein
MMVQKKKEVAGFGLRVAGYKRSKERETKTLRVSGCGLGGEERSILASHIQHGHVLVNQ